MLFFLTPLTVFAANKVVVIPLFDTTNPMPLKNIITVAKGNGNFTDPVAAVNSITGASATNPYLVVIGPGVYTITSTLVMKPFVDIAGSGENVTKITGAISTGTEAIISGANNSALSSLTVQNNGGGSNSVALKNNNASPIVSNVTAIAGGGTLNCGIWNVNSTSVMTNVTAKASGGTSSYGVYNFYSSPVMTDVRTEAYSGLTNIGVNNYQSYAVMTGVLAQGLNGPGYGVYNIDSSPSIRRSTMFGQTDGLYADGTASYKVTVSQSTIFNGVGGSGTKTCIACDNGSGIALNTTCN